MKDLIMIPIIVFIVIMIVIVLSGIICAIANAIDIEIRKLEERNQSQQKTK